jgi:EAL domain-containing protein (putative c-di-GMP-specific phosphodiesterase class I)
LAQVLEQTGLEPHGLELEITETVLIENLQLVSKTLNKLHQMGLQISLDDFGTGYSSLGYLKQLPLHTLKIDRSFVNNIENNNQDRAIISAIITLGYGLGLRVVAEGVETPQQRDVLISLQCQEMQGYLFSKPLTAEDATEFLSASKF